MSRNQSDTEAADNPVKRALRGMPLLYLFVRPSTRITKSPASRIAPGTRYEEGAGNENDN